LLLRHARYSGKSVTFVREGHLLVITRLDCSVLDLPQTKAKIVAKKVDLVVLDQAIDFGSPTDRLLFHMLAAIGEFERDPINEHAATGIVKAKAAGVILVAARPLTKPTRFAQRSLASARYP
jgi:DNA invertase Pin-like site-specific DNA recombinase